MQRAEDSPWRVVEPHVPFPDDAALRLTLIGGQCFRWAEPTPGEFVGHWARHTARVRRSADGLLECYHGPDAPPVTEIAAYFAAGVDFEALAAALPWRSDAVLQRAMAAAGGVRLLRQPPGETLLCYLCSSTKRIPQIRELTDRLAATLGPGPGLLPDWQTLATTPEESLRALGLGYRARYVAEAAQALAQQPPDWESRLAAMPYAEAHAFLGALPGVGPKIADCVCLFGLEHHGAFPVDTWILQVMEGAYGLTGWRPAQIAHFAAIHFGPAAGLAQQYLFEAARTGQLNG